MVEIFQRQLLWFLRVPPRPTTPPGETDVRVFRAAPRFYTWRRVKWGGSQFVGLATVLIANASLGDESGLWIGSPSWGQIINALLWGGWSFQLVLTYLLIRLDYQQRWYILTDRTLRIREGVLRLHETTMTFANIQHLTVKQGPLQRLLGIADLEVRTAGGGGGGTPGAQPGQRSATANTHIAYFRGVDNAAEIRAAIRDRIRRYRDAGLGDPDDLPPVWEPGISVSGPAGDFARTGLDVPGLIAAARDLAAEARALRGAMVRGEG
jgi:membrane protein YdbS with pleckstrin-like domain